MADNCHKDLQCWIASGAYFDQEG